MEYKKERARLGRDSLHHDADRTTQQGAPEQRLLTRSFTLGRNNQAVVPPLCSASGWGLSRKRMALA